MESELSRLMLDGEPVVVEVGRRARQLGGVGPGRWRVGQGLRISHQCHFGINELEPSCCLNPQKLCAAERGFKGDSRPILPTPPRP